MKIGGGWIFFIVFHMAMGQKYTMEHQGKKRSYLVHLPQGYEKGRQYPLVLSFHGWGGSSDEQRRYTRMDDVADKEKFIVVYPQSYHHFWNAGVLDNHYTHGKDDVGFVRSLLGHLKHDFPVDADSVYVVGLSLGGIFCHRLACELDDQIAAFASVSGLLSDSTEHRCPKGRPLPMLLLHGTKDHFVKYKGNREYVGAEKTVGFWAKRNGCMRSDTLLLPDVDKNDKTRCTLIRFDCQDKTQVWFLKIKGGGHTWPQSGMNYWYFGRTSRDVDASQFIWNFFRQFRLQREGSM